MNDIVPSPSPALTDDGAASEPSEDQQTTEKSPELIRLEAVASVFSNLLRDPKIVEAYMKDYRSRCQSQVVVRRDTPREGQQSDSTGQNNLSDDTPRGVVQCETEIQSLNILHRQYIVVDPNYYSFDIGYRQHILGAPAPEHLCKSVVFVNKNYKPIAGIEGDLNPLNPKYYLVIVQFLYACNNVKLIDFVRKLGGDALPRSRYNFRLAPSEVALELTGFSHNEVAPVGTTAKIPVIISKAITELVPKVFYAGAGHRDWKLVFDTDEFLEKTGCMIADLS
jgi:hypothetical protein